MFTDVSEVTTKSAFAEIAEGVEEYQQFVKDFSEIAKKIIDPNIDFAKRADYYSQMKSLLARKDQYTLHTKLDEQDITKLENKVDEMLSKIQVYTPVPVKLVDGTQGAQDLLYNPKDGDDVVLENGKPKSVTIKNGDKTYTCYLAILRDKDGKAVSAKDLLEKWDTTDKFTSKWSGTGNESKQYGEELGWTNSKQTNADCQNQASLTQTDKNAFGKDSDTIKDGFTIQDSAQAGCSANSTITSTADAKNAATYGISQYTGNADYEKDFDNFINQMIDN